jgi:hypothetical protein
MQPSQGRREDLAGAGSKGEGSPFVAVAELAGPAELGRDFRTDEAAGAPFLVDDESAPGAQALGGAGGPGDSQG